MQVTTTIALLLTCELCASIRVPTTWDEGDSEVKQNTQDFSVETVRPLVQSYPTKPVPVEYFEYTAKKPQFAVDVASFHGVQSPENHYKAYPIKPYTGRERPELGKHKVLNTDNKLHRPFQEFANINEPPEPEHVAPVSSSYEVFHPYEAEVPGLQDLYRDPILNKIRNDLENSKNRLQKYEKEAGEPDVSKEEYLESPHKTGNRLVPHRNAPAPFEIHRPQRRPVYYRYGPRPNHRENYLNHKLRHPWNQYVKVRPVHYQPIKNHIHHLRQNHALKYDDEKNEYPQVQEFESYSDPKDGYDIYEHGKEKYVQLRNNVDESINKAVNENRPATYGKLEMQNNDSSNDSGDEDEFVPIKNYAQVRKTETFKHLPKSAALVDAETFDEIRNAPRLREAVKSTKAQTVYSEEGYEDAAYDHAGEQKHASENEGHGGFLKQNELSGGKYKTPSESGKFEDHSGSEFRDQLVHGKIYKDDDKDEQKETEEEDYEEDEHEHLLEADNHQDHDPSESDDGTTRTKREDTADNKTVTNNINKTNKIISQHELDKRETKFKVPEINLNTTFWNEKDFVKLSNLKLEPQKDDLRSKYPYYFKNLKSLSKHSPLRYAENLKLIPKKSKGGTEFYDSRSSFECSEVDDVPDPIPDKLRKNGHPDEDENGEESTSKGEENFDTTKKQPRLKGLGDKIDCFKAKYFGENPLDSPFFKEDIILNPEPPAIPNLAVYRLINSPISNFEKEPNVSESKSSNIVDLTHKLNSNNITDLYKLIDKLRNDKNVTNKDKSFISNIKMFKSVLQRPQNKTISEEKQFDVYSDILDIIKNNLKKGFNQNITLLNLKPTVSSENFTNSYFQNKDDIRKSPPSLRKKRATPFIYEPYKIIRDSQVQDSKKTTTTSNISPLIKQLQSSRIVDKVISHEDSDKHVKRNVNSRIYKDIGRKDRESIDKNTKPTEDAAAIIDVSVDKRRGEPRYEVRHANHKFKYTPVENKTAISVEDYKSQTNLDVKASTLPVPQTRKRRPTSRPFFDVSKFIPTAESQNVAASNSVRKTISTTTTIVPKTLNNNSEGKDVNDSEDYEDYEDEEHDITTTTTTTSPKPSFRRRNRIKTTTEKIPETIQPQRLKLVTRFRDYKPDSEIKEHTTEKTVTRKQKQLNDDIAPKYREQKKKLTKSTLVTDTKKYGTDKKYDDDDDDMHKEEVDAMIGVKQNIDDYMPSYEKKILNKKASKESIESDQDDAEIEDEEDDDEDDDDDDSNDEEEDEDDDDDDIDYEDVESEDLEEASNESELVPTTSEPTKRTLAMTTEAPTPTLAARLELKPIVTKKKIEIHTELPANKSSPHVTQYKQDIKEVEIIKEMPVPRKKRPNKNVETLDLYKDENLPKQINKLMDVEVFKENLDLNSGPKHGGNYRSAEEITTTPKIKGDTEASQTEYRKHVEQDNAKKRRISPQTRTDSKPAKLIELSEPTETSLHGGNLRYKGRTRNEKQSEKLIELEDEDIDDSKDYHEENRFRGRSRNERPMHGGNYRSADLKVDDPKSRINAKEARRKGADLLSSFAKAIPILTTTPSYILDPSKRMYYYVDD